MASADAVSVVNKEQLLRNGKVDFEARRLIIEAVEATLSAIKPQLLVKKHLRLKANSLFVSNYTVDLSNIDRIFVVGGGKASAAMAEALNDILNDKITGGIITIPKYQNQKFKTGSIKLKQAGHPIPTLEAAEAVKSMFQLLNHTTEKDLVFCLISGGGSALLASPTEGISLDEKQSITKALLRSGATIAEFNTVRKHLSNIKGGRLAGKIYPAKTIGLIISDVTGDPVETIASGPTSPDSTTFKDAIAVLKKYWLWSGAPESIRKILEKGEKGTLSESPKPGDKIFQKVYNFIIGSNSLACESACKYLKSKSIDTSILTVFLEGEAREAGKIISSIARYMKPKKPESKGASIILGGETTVTVRGKGKGGRNQELVLSACRGIENIRGLAIAAVGTDGIDGFTEAAGGIVDSFTLRNAKKSGLDVESYLQNNDSNSFLEKLGDTIVTGPTGTNLNDIIIAVYTFNGKI